MESAARLPNACDMQLDYLIHQALGMPRGPPSRGYQLSPVWSDRRQIGEAISVETQGFGVFNITGLRNWSTDIC
jgi:hypothetical protein